MDEQQFDTLAKTLVGIGSRRHVLRASLAAVGALLVAQASASGKNKTGRKKKGGKKKGKKGGTTNDGGTNQQNTAPPPPTDAAPPPPPPPPPRTCAVGQCTSDNYCGPGCVCLDIGGVKRRCLAAGTCSAEPCTVGSCGPDCTCVNPDGGRTRCVSAGACPAGTCSEDSCGPGCICVGIGAATRCASTAP